MKIAGDKNANMGSMAFASIAIGVIMALVLAGALLTVGLNINSGLSDSSPIDANSSYYNASQSVIRGTTSAYEMTGTMQIVIVAGGIIMLLLSVFGGLYLYAR